MKTTKLIKCALCVAVLAAFGLVGCEKLELYSIDAPADLQDRIDSIAAAKASVDTGDTTYIDLSTTVVGETDFSSGWWTAFTDYFTIPSGKLLHLEYKNYTDGVNNYDNWVLIICNVADRDADDYAEYFALRADAYGWNGSMDDEDASYAYNSSLLSYSYPDTDGDGDVWNDFRTYMNGATVTMEIDHSATGNVYVTATAVATDGTVLTETYNQPVSASDNIVAFLVTEEGYLEMQKAYLIPSKVTVVEDQNPVSIAITGAPSFVELGNTNFWGDAVATVTYADGSTAEVDSSDLSFTVVPDMTTTGTKTVVVAYSKTKQGEYCQAISNLYTLEVTNSVSSIAVTTLPNITTYHYYSSDSIIFSTTGIVVTATYSDGSTAIMDNDALVFGKIPAASGTQNVLISYVGASSTVTTTCPLTLVKGVSQVGATDFSSGWWTVFSSDYTVASGSSKTFKMYLYSDNAANWHSPCTILRNAAASEYGVVRMDNYGWGTGYSTATLTSDWDWTTFTANQNGSYVEITVTNNGNNTANIYYSVTYANGTTHYQSYAGITVDSSDLNCALVTEESYLVFVE